MRVWKPVTAHSDRVQGSGLAVSLLEEIRAIPSLEALAMFEADWISGRHRSYPHQWLIMVQDEAECRRADLRAEQRMGAMDKQFQNAMDRDD